VPDKDGNLTEAEKDAMRQAQEDMKKELEEIRRQGEKN
jgi:hypothetical protein